MRLQTASSNLRNMAKDAKEEASAAVCNRYDSFEQDYELDDGGLTASLRIEEPAEEEEAKARRRGWRSMRPEGGRARDDARLLARRAISPCTPTARLPAARGPHHVHDREDYDQRVRILLI